MKKIGSFFVTFGIMLVMIFSLAGCGNDAKQSENSHSSDSTNTYTITWKNYDGTVLETDTSVAYGTTPSYDATTPTKESTNQYSYAFTGWTPEISSVTGDATYTAQFSETTNTYTITWKNYDGTVLETDTSVAYGTTPSYDSTTPTKESTNQYSYAFTGWAPEMSSVTGDATYTAQFSEKDLNVLEFTKSTNKFNSNNTSNEETASVISEKNETYNFGFANYKSVLGRWGQLNRLGYFYNTTKIDGIDSLIIETTNSSDKLIVSFGYKTINGEIIFSESVGYNCSEQLLIDNCCNYIKIFNAGSSDIIINSIRLHFSNEEGVELHKNDAIYQFEVISDNISCTIKSVQNASEVKDAYLSDYYQGYKITNISNDCFYNCSYIETLTIPFISLTDAPNGNPKLFIGRLFGTVSFENTTKIIQKYSVVSGSSPYEYTKSYYYPNNLKKVHIDGGYSTRTFWGCTVIEDVTFGDNVVSIGNYCFSDCTNLKNVDFGWGATTIGFGAFRNCTLLSTINLESNITTIGYEAFEGCTFNSLLFPNNITTLNQHAFYNCNITGNIYISKTVTSIGEVAFNFVSNSSIKPTIYCEVESALSGWNTKWNYYNYPVVWGYYDIIDNFLMCYRNGALCLIDYKGVISNEINTPSKESCSENYQIYSNFVNNDNVLETIILSDNCVGINNNAFVNCSNLKYIVIHNGEIDIEINAFSGTNLIECLYFAGDYEDWKHEPIYNDYIVAFYSETNVSDTTAGLYYWHYINGIPTINY